MPKGIYQHKKGIRKWLVKANTNAIWSEERKKQWSETAKKYGNGKWMKGKRLPLNVCKKIGNSLKNGKRWGWKKEWVTPQNIKIRRSIEFRLWREAVFARDNWTCQKCKQKGRELNPHHIKNFSNWIDLRFAIDNGVTLCKGCHLKFHKKYGQYKNTQEQLLEFLF